MVTIHFSDKFNRTTRFVQSQQAIWLTQLWNVVCGENGTDLGPIHTRGLCVLETLNKRYEGDDFELVESRDGDDYLELCWKVGRTGLIWRSSWRIQPEAGIWSRRDRLENISQSSIEIRRCLARIPFGPGHYEIYTQSSNWARENQGHWNNFFGSRLTLRSHSGRTTQIANPYLFIRESGADHGIAFHILPRGNWSLHVDRTSTVRDEFAPFTVIELGHSDDALRLQLAANTTLELPEILIQDIPYPQPEANCAVLHRYILEKYFSNLTIAPVVYNTWFDQFDILNVERLQMQLKIAKEIGCEVFVVDAGWYGRGTGDWHKQVGDWREKLDGAFHGELTKFAEDVRATGLGFGLWMEPERNNPDAPIVQEHPEWFLPGLGGFLYPDLSQPVVYQYVLHELSRLVETYQLAWMKIDFNFELGDSTDELHGYFECWYQLLDELRSKYSKTFFEGCASGGMRLDLNTFTHFDAHFLSDTVNPIDMLRITQGAMLRLPPGRITRWAVLRQHDTQIIMPGSGSWDNSMVVDPDFLCKVALPGMFGISGDLVSLDLATHHCLNRHITFYKTWRNFIAGATCHLLTPIRSLDDRSGCVAFQLDNPRQPDKSLVFVYRLLDGSAQHSFTLRDLDPGIHYNITDINASDTLQAVSASELLSSGLTVHLPHANSAAVFVLQAVHS